MSAKEILFGTDARTKICEGVDIIANAVKVTLEIGRASCRERVYVLV